MKNQVDLILYRLKLLLFMRRLYPVFNVVKLTTILLQLKLKCKNKYTRLIVIAQECGQTLGLGLGLVDRNRTVVYY